MMMVGRDLFSILGVGGLELLRRRKRIRTPCGVGIAVIEQSAHLCGVRKPVDVVADDPAFHSLTLYSGGRSERHQDDGR